MVEADTRSTIEVHKTRSKKLRRPEHVLEEAPFDLCTEPEDHGTDMKVWSNNKLLGPLSYMNPRILANNLSGYAPPPTILKYSELVRTDPISKEEVFDKIEIMNKGGIKFCDERLHEKSKGVVRDVLS